MPNAPQSYANHARFDPMFHFFLLPVLLINLIVTIVILIREWPHHIPLHGWVIVMALALIILAGVARSSALRAQDRIIRLEESLRYQRVLTPELLAASQPLTIRQIIALRFASDAELAGLVQRTLSESLPPKAIKQAIVNWRADNLRV
jgi:hypothetical protein